MTDNAVMVVRLVDERRPAGPATILEISNAPIATLLARYMDRDGARDSALRVWRAHPGARVGDRCSLGAE